MNKKKNNYKIFPDKDGRFGKFGGRFVAETLMPLLLAVEEEYKKAKNSKSFKSKLKYYFENYIGRPSPLYLAERLSSKLNGAKLYFKRDELNHTGAHKINNCVGQILLAMQMGKQRIVAETGAGQHGLATATVCALFNLKCIIYMGEVDIKRQAPNVFKMKLLGAQIQPVKSGRATLKDAMNEALRDWVSNVEDTFYVIGTAAGPHPYPMMVRDFQSIIGDEAKKQILKYEKKLPNYLVACIGGGSNALGLFYSFLNDSGVNIIGVEAGGEGVNSKKHAASLAKGKPGFLHGNYTYLLQDSNGQINDAHSISAGLDYPGIGPEHSWLKEVGRVKYVSATDKQALSAFKLCSKLEGIIPALEPSHALAYLIKNANKFTKKDIIIMNMCGRGDKDIFSISDKLGVKL
ncbi:MAG: tryptophan synthase subunit beta [Alphaproteobacteria bacterium]|tara:strand:+ start:4394 stop:5608 length:1215 start_codon:yes stop_codon:yes gene_type:complete